MSDQEKSSAIRLLTYCLYHLESPMAISNEQLFVMECQKNFIDPEYVKNQTEILLNEIGWILKDSVENKIKGLSEYITDF